MPDDIKIPLSAKEAETIMSVATVVHIALHDEFNMRDGLSDDSHASGSIKMGSGNPKILDPWLDWKEKLTTIANEAKASSSIAGKQLEELSELVAHFRKTIPQLFLASTEEFATADMRKGGQWTPKMMHGARHDSVGRMINIRNWLEDIAEIVESKKGTLTRINQGPSEGLER